MRAYVEEVRKMELRFKGIQMEHVPRADNSIADELSKIAARREPVPPGAFIERLTRLTIDKGNMQGSPGATARGGPPGSTPPGGEVSAITPGGPPWADDIMKFLQGQELPDDDGNAERVARQAKMYVLVDGELHQRRANGMLLKCIPREEGVELLADIHRGLCSHHVASRTLARKAVRHGFFWPTALSDAEHLVRTCEACQFHAKNIYQPAQALQVIPLSWPFAV
jgi:hypothetical protein